MRQQSREFATEVLAYYELRRTKDRHYVSRSVW